VVRPSRLTYLGRKPWTREQIKTLLFNDGATETARLVRLVVALAYFTGQRIGDIMALRWGDIKNGNFELVQQKTGKRLVIPLHEVLQQFLPPAGEPGDRIVQLDGRPIRKYEFYRPFRAERARLGLPKDLYIHGLRKSCAMHMIENGASLFEAMSVTGQSRHVLEYYVKARDQYILAESGVKRLGGRDVWHKDDTEGVHGG
jgi:integrase